MRISQKLAALLCSTVLCSGVAQAEMIQQGKFLSSEAADKAGTDDIADELAQVKAMEDDDSVIELNNATIERKYGKQAVTSSAKSKTTSSASSAIGSWMVKHPLPSGRLTSTFGVRTLLGTTRHHSGIDLAAPTGTPIYASGPGIVTKAGWGNGYGNYVEVDHGNGYMTRYGHASRINVSVGQRVSAGQVIAAVGCTGRCTGPHLHYEVVKNGQRKNPSTYLAMLP